MSEPSSGSGRPLRVGVVGAGFWGLLAHLPALQAVPGVEPVAIATTRMESASAIAQQHGLPLAFDDPSELIAHPDVDAVAVVVKVPKHEALIREALAAGKHVYSEWPLVTSLDAAVALADTADARGVTHMVGLQGLRHPGALYVRKLIEDDFIGQPVAVSIVETGGPAGHRIPQAGVVETLPEYFASVLTITSAHMLSGVEASIGRLGEVAGQVATVYGKTTVIETGETIPMHVPDQVAFAGRFDNGAVLSFAAQVGPTPIGAEPDFHLRILGTTHTLVVSGSPVGPSHIVDWRISAHATDGSSERVSLPDGFDSTPSLPAADPAPEAPAWLPLVPRGVARMYGELAAAVVERRPAAPNFHDGVRYHRIVDAIQRSSDTGVRQSVEDGAGR